MVVPHSCGAVKFRLIFLCFDRLNSRLDCADSHEDVVFEVAKFSMEKRSSVPLDVQVRHLESSTRVDGYGACVPRYCTYSQESRSDVLLVWGNLQRISQVDLEKRGVWKRKQDPKQSTQFTYSRFYIPYLQNYKGWAYFCDDDFLWLGDFAVRSHLHVEAAFLREASVSLFVTCLLRLAKVLRNGCRWIG